MNNRDIKKVNTDCLSEIGLIELEKVRLMNRMDLKYWFHIDQLQAVLNEIKDCYYVLKIDNKTVLPYSTTYFDTLEDKMFIDHHNGKKNRYKIRRRSYLSTGQSFLEVKFKNNKGRTIKERIESDFENTVFNKKESMFLLNNSPYNHTQLRASLLNKFSRITIVNKNFQERCTIDLNLNFTSSTTSITIADLVIIEIKTGRNDTISPLMMTLRDKRIKPSGFSKYCIGRAITDSNLKQNQFKQIIRTLEKQVRIDFSYYNSKVS